MIEPPNVGTATSLSFGETPSMVRRETVDDLRVRVQAARGGDERAFERLYEQFGRMVHGVLLARVPTDHVDDLVQDVFMTAWQRLDQLKEEAAFGSWLATIARNRARDFHRQRPDFVRLDETAPAPASSPTAPLEARRALSAIRTLPDAYRETLVLRLVEGLTGPEIAERTGLTPASVRVNLHRGMTLLRHKLGVEP
jgi:RNA polymerase sigma-70 factor (ECF subfamily)